MDKQEFLVNCSSTLENQQYALRKILDGAMARRASPILPPLIYNANKGDTLHAGDALPFFLCFASREWDKESFSPTILLPPLMLPDNNAAASTLHASNR